MSQRKRATEISRDAVYGQLLAEITGLLESARRVVVRRINSILTATYWDIGRRIVQHEQSGQHRAEYGEQVVTRLAGDLTKQHGRGFSKSNLFQMRAFFQGWQIFQTPSGKFEAQAKFESLTEAASSTPAKSDLVRTEVNSDMPANLPPVDLTEVFPMSWSHYVRLLSVTKPHARAFYEAEAIRGGWSVRQLDRQISTQLFERTSQSKRQTALLAKAQQARPEDAISVQDEIRDPYLLEFLNLKDEYSETELEDSLIRRVEWFLLKLVNCFTFVARQ